MYETMYKFAMFLKYIFLYVMCICLLGCMWRYVLVPVECLQKELGPLGQKLQGYVAYLM